MGELQPATIVAITAASVFGMVLALLGSLKVNLAKRFDLADGQMNRLLVILNTTLAPMMVAGGLVVDFAGFTWALVIGSVVTALALFGFANWATRLGVVTALLLAGFGGAVLSIAGLVLMPEAFFGPRQVTASLNLGNVFVALGALVTPPLTALLLRRLAWSRVLALLAVACLTPGLLAAFFYDSMAQLQAPPEPSSDLLTGHAIWLAGLVFFFYAPLEGAVSVWGATYLVGSESTDRRAGWGLSAFWGTFVASRLATAFAATSQLSSRWWDKPVLVVLPLLAAAVLGNLAGTANRRLAWRGTLLLGFLLGPIFPTLVSVLFQSLQGHATGTGYGIVFALGSLGSLILAPVLAAAARRHDIRLALRIPMLLALVLTAAALVFCLLVEVPDGGRIK